MRASGRSIAARLSILSRRSDFPAHAASLADPSAYWGEKAQLVAWQTPPKTILDNSRDPFAEWYGGGITNLCFNALDKHLKLRASQNALIFHSAVTGETLSLTYAQLHSEVCAAATMLSRRCGVHEGDRVLIYMPTINEAVVAMLACVRLGAIHSVVFGGFAAQELRARIADSAPKAIITASFGREASRVVPYAPPLVEALSGLSSSGLPLPSSLVMLSRGHRRGEEAAAAAEAAAENAPRVLSARGCAVQWLHWAAEMSAAKQLQPAPLAWLPSSAPSYIIYTSGSTGAPKGVVRDTGGHAVALTAAMSEVYNMRPGEVWWAASDIGWVVGHSFTVYGPLLLGCTSLLFEGKPVGTPDHETLWRTAARFKVSGMFSAPTALRAIKREDAEGLGPARHDLSSLRTLFLAGERCDPDTLAWATRALSPTSTSVIDHWWATEFGSPVLARPLTPGSSLPRGPLASGSAGVPVPGYDVRVLAPHIAAAAGAELFETTASGAVAAEAVQQHQQQPLGAGPTCHATLSPHPHLPEARAGELGAVVVRLPLPPGALTGLWNAEKRYRASYTDPFPGYFSAGDAGFANEHGQLSIMGRADDVINVAGHRLSAGAMEAAVAAHGDVAECAVIGVADALKGSMPVALIVLRAGAHPGGEAAGGAAARVRRDIGAFATLRAAVVVPRLPKTRSGKVLRATLRSIADGVAFKVPATIEEPAALEEAAAALRGVGLAKLQ
jgi:propionyl-CoA synthetase